jgi:hypothetical protein
MLLVKHARMGRRHRRARHAPRPADRASQRAASPRAGPRSPCSRCSCPCPWSTPASISSARPAPWWGTGSPWARAGAPSPRAGSSPCWARALVHTHRRRRPRAGRALARPLAPRVRGPRGRGRCDASRSRSPVHARQPRSPSAAVVAVVMTGSAIPLHLAQINTYSHHPLARARRDAAPAKRRPSLARRPARAADRACRRLGS